jgi:hypothetical protein
MFRRANQRRVIGLALVLAGCTEQVVLNDVWDASPSDLVVPKDTQSGSDAYCAEKYTPLTFVPQPAQLLILLDRSSDMQSSFGSTTREAAAQNALVSAVEAFQGKIKFGFDQFPVDPAVSQCAQGSCCADKVSIIDPALDNTQAMKSSILCSDPHNTSCSVASADSPSYAALATVRDYYNANPTTDDLYILLVTSSEPTCASEDQCSSARSAANNLGDAGVRIIVLSVGYEPELWSCLSQIGRKGSSPRASQSLYTASSVSDVGSKLNDIFSVVAQSACTMNSSIVPPSQAQLQVSIGKTPVSQTDWNNPDGWSATPNQTSITLSGSACDSYLNSQDKLLVGYACSPCGGPNACTP